MILTIIIESKSKKIQLCSGDIQAHHLLQTLSIDVIIKCCMATCADNFKKDSSLSPTGSGVVPVVCQMPPVATDPRQSATGDCFIHPEPSPSRPSGQNPSAPQASPLGKGHCRDPGPRKGKEYRGTDIRQTLRDDETTQN